MTIIAIITVSAFFYYITFDGRFADSMPDVKFKFRPRRPSRRR